ncbi:hypothetical protein HOY80DRAFT_1040464 [Tuber brumale]|nr:hypothetical protein HOY80DRAFT_1040464 [Tuber brumale]
MPSPTSTPFQTSPTPAARSAMRDLLTNPNNLQDLLELWTIILSDPETPEAEVDMIGAQVDFIEWGLREALEAIRRRMRMLEAEGHGRGGAELARGEREG